jgi:hypothetical protein
LREIDTAAVDREGDSRRTPQSENVMSNAAVIHKLRLGALGLVAGLALSAAPIANAHGGGGGGHGAGFGGGHGGFGPRQGGREGFGFGRFGYRSVGFYGFGVLGYGLFFDALPLYYSTYWWDGIPYYYANDNFYQWNAAVGQYESVRAPQNLVSLVTTTQTLGNGSLFAYPKNGQTSAQQASDRIDCQHWATSQTGSNSSPAISTAAVGATAARRQDYLRAESACLEGRGYSVE